MKKLTIILLFAFLVLMTKDTAILKAQNICTETLTRYNYTVDSFYYDIISVNLTAMRVNNQINITSANKLIELNGFKMSVDTVYDYRMAYAVFALNGFCNWGQTQTLNLFKGDYEASGLDSNQIGFFDIYMCDSRLSQDRLLIHARHELEARNTTLMDELIDSTCIGLRYYDNQIVVGKLISHSESQGKAFLLLDNQLTTWVVDWYSVAKATNDEINKYY